MIEPLPSETEAKWLKVCRALKEAGKTDSIFYLQGERVIGAARLKKLLDGH